MNNYLKISSVGFVIIGVYIIYNLIKVSFEISMAFGIFSSIMIFTLCMFLIGLEKDVKEEIKNEK